MKRKRRGLERAMVVGITAMATVRVAATVVAEITWWENMAYRVKRRILLLPRKDNA
jgi:hypothetical protein